MWESNIAVHDSVHAVARALTEHISALTRRKVVLVQSHTAAPAGAPMPAGSDPLLASYDGEDFIVYTLQLDDGKGVRVVVVAASDGMDPVTAVAALCAQGIEHTPLTAFPELGGIRGRDYRSDMDRRKVHQGRTDCGCKTSHPPAVDGVHFNMFWSVFYPASRSFIAKEIRDHVLSFQLPPSVRILTSHAKHRAYRRAELSMSRDPAAWVVEGGIWASPPTDVRTRVLEAVLSFVGRVRADGTSDHRAVAARTSLAALNPGQWTLRHIAHEKGMSALGIAGWLAHLTSATKAAAVNREAAGTFGGMDSAIAAATAVLCCRAEESDLSLAGVTGIEFLSAVLVGYEVSARAWLTITSKQGGAREAQGLWDSLGAAAAACRLLGLTQGQTMNALAAIDQESAIDFSNVTLDAMCPSGLMGNTSSQRVMQGVRAALDAAGGHVCGAAPASHSGVIYYSPDNLSECIHWTDLGRRWHILHDLWPPTSASGGHRLGSEIANAVWGLEGDLHGGATLAGILFSSPALDTNRGSPAAQREIATLPGEAFAPGSYYGAAFAPFVALMRSG